MCDASSVPQAAESAYELAKDFSEESPTPKKGADDIYRVPVSNLPVNHIDNQRILFHVCDQFL